MAEITRWQIQTLVVNIAKFNLATGAEVDPTLIWAKKDKEGRTDWEKLNQIAYDGWELVSVTPIISNPANSQTTMLLYTFKRPVAEL